MSGTSDTPAPAPGESHVHSFEGGHHEGGEHGTFKGYMTGFVLSVILTAVPFWFVMGDVFASTALTVVLILLLGIVQIFVHLRYFLHMDSRAEEGWQLMALFFTLILVVIVLVGSVWVMAHLNANMMLTPVRG